MQKRQASKLLGILHEWDWSLDFFFGAGVSWGICDAIQCLIFSSNVWQAREEKKKTEGKEKKTFYCTIKIMTLCEASPNFL